MTTNRMGLEQTLSDERLELFIRQPLDNGITRGEQMELAREALARRKASKEPVAYIGVNMLNDMRDENRQSGRVWINDIGSGECIPLYSAPPLQDVTVPTFDEWVEFTDNKPLGWVRDAMRESYDACRSAMLSEPRARVEATSIDIDSIQYQSLNRGE